MDALVAKAEAFDQTRKRKRSFHTDSKGKKVSTKEQAGILSSVAGRTGLPASLAAASASASNGTGDSTSHRHIKDKKLRAHLQSQSEHTLLTKSLNAEVEDPLFDITNEFGGDVPVGITVEGDLEKTWRISQDEIVKSVGEENARMRKEVRLDGGPYRVRYTRNGRRVIRPESSKRLIKIFRHLAIIGKKGHAATFDALTGNLHSEIQLKETCRDIT